MAMPLQEPEPRRGPRALPHLADPARRWGYSIPEMVIVLVVVSALAYIAVPNIEIVRYKMDGAARGMVAALVAAQRLAVQRQHDVVVSFDTLNRSVRIHQDRDNDGTIDDGEPTRVVPFDEGVVFGPGPAPWLGDAARSVTFTETHDGLPAVRYIRNGSASEEGTVYLSSSRSQRSADHAKDARAVRVDRSTGRVTWFSYEPPDWSEDI